jgi:Tol biopolymer transport system component
MQHTPFSPDGKRTAFSAKKDGKWSIVLDGVSGPRLERTYGPFFSQDGRHVAYVGEEGGKQFLVLDGARKSKYDSVFWGSSPFSPNGAHVAYIATMGTKKFVVVDNKPGEEFDGVGFPVFSPDSNTVAYVAQFGKEMFVVVNGKRGTSYEGIWWGGPTFSPNSRRLAFIAKVGQKWQVVVDGRGGRAFNSIWSNQYYFQAFQLTISFPHCLVFSPDSLHLAYVGIDGDQEYVMLDERASGPYDGVGGALLSASGTGATTRGNFAMAGKAAIAVGGGDTVDRRVLVFSADSSRLAFGTRQGRALWWRVIAIKNAE